jgi:sugar O-acyltransferase (sialic acid O-acetyltransferase NeuD family)
MQPTVSAAEHEAGVILIGYSGHAWVVGDCIRASGGHLVGYAERGVAAANPLGLPYLGKEGEADFDQRVGASSLFVAIGDNDIRRKVHTQLRQAGYRLAGPAVHPTAAVSGLAHLENNVLVSAQASVNAGAVCGEGTIINTAAVVEHGCRIGPFAHIGPGAVLTGDVMVGAGSFIGAAAVVRPGISIGRQSIIGAGAVVLRDVPDYTVVVGNPAKPLKRDI